MRFHTGTLTPAFDPAVAEFERTADFEPSQYAAGDKSERFCTEPGCTYPASIKCAHFGCPQRKPVAVAPPATVHNGGAGQSGGVSFHSATDSAGEQHDHHA